MLFSVIIPAYNYAHCLPRAIESAISQKGDDFEIIIIDDGSKDNTAEVAAEYCRRCPALVNYIYQENKGLAAVRNRGVKESVGDYLIFLDADDRLLDDALEKFRNFLEKGGSPDMVFAGHLSVHPDGTQKEHLAESLSPDPDKNFARYVRKRFGISNGATVMSRRIFEKIKYPEHLRNSEDISVFAQTLALFDCRSFSDPVLEIFKHDDSLRNNIEFVLKTGTDLVDVVFDPQILPPHLIAQRKEFYSYQCLSLFRSLYLAGRYGEARGFFYRAVRLSPRSIFVGSYFSKYVRSFFKSSTPSL